MGLYSSEQVKRLLTEILNQLPVNDNKLISVKKYITDKINNIDVHI